MWKIFKKITALEIIIFVIFFVYLVFDIQMPIVINQYIDSPLGVVVVLVLALCVFLYTNPILGILSIFVAYEIIRRSSFAPKIQYKAPIRIQREQPQISQMDFGLNKKPTFTHESTVEEEVISKMAPLATDAPTAFVDTSFKPIAENTHNATAIV